MPHTSRRRNKSSAAQQSKVVHIEADDGWTHVSRSSQKKPRSVPPEFRDANENIANASRPSQKSTVETHYTAAELGKHYERVRRAWLESSERTALRHHFQQHSHACRSITKSVCLGLGSPSRMFFTMGSLKQFALWLDMLSMIQDTTGKPVEAYAQDPVFNMVDRKFLPEYGVTVIDHPLAADHIDAQCFVFGPHFSMAYAPRTMRTAGAPLTICNDVAPFIDASSMIQETLPASVDPQSQATREEWSAFLTERDSTPFLGNSKMAFEMQVNDMQIYWRRFQREQQ